jgi:hypothetical protein
VPLLISIHFDPPVDCTLLLWSIQHQPLGKSTVRPATKSVLVYGEAFGYDRADGSSTWIDKVKIHIQKEKTSGGFWLKASVTSDLNGQLAPVLSSQGVFRIRIFANVKNYQLDTIKNSGSYVIVPDGQGGTLRLTFDARGYSPKFDARAGDAVFVRANLVTKSDAVLENTTLVENVYQI